MARNTTVVNWDEVLLPTDLSVANSGRDLISNTSKRVTLSLNKKSTITIEPLFWLFFTLYCVVYFFLFYYQSINHIGHYGDFQSDFQAYILEAIGVKSGLPFPYRGLIWLIELLHFVLPISFASSLAILVLFVPTAIIIKCILEFTLFSTLSEIYQPSNPTRKSLHVHLLISLLCFCLLFLVSISIPQFSPFFYRNVLSANVVHNQTGMAARTFSIIVFVFMSLILTNLRSSLRVSHLLIFSISLLVALWVKPTFSTVYLPVYGIILLIELFREKCKNWRRVLLVCVAFIPALVLLLYQYVVVFGRNEGIGFQPLRLLETRTPLFILQSIAFPLYILLTNVRSFSSRDRSVEGISWRISWYGFVCAVIQRYCFYEKGSRIEDGNFGWGYILALFFLFITSLIVWVKSMKVSKSYPYHFGAAFLFACHTICGAIYFAWIFLGGHFNI